MDYRTRFDDLARIGPVLTLRLDKAMDSLDLDPVEVARTRAVSLVVPPERLADALRVVLALGPLVVDDTLCRIVSPGPFARGGYAVLTRALEENGWINVHADYGSDAASLVLRRCRHPQVEDFEVSFYFQGRAVSLTFPTGQDMLRNFPLHGHTFHELPLLDHIRRTVPGGGWALDCGAHVGGHAVYLALFAGFRVVAFEPHPRTFAALAHNVLANGLEDRVVARNLALGRSPARLRVRDYGLTNPGAATYTEDPGGDIAQLPLDDCPDLPDGPIDLIKLDVESMEAEVIQGARRILAAHRPVVFLEVRSESEDHALDRLMSEIGYGLVHRLSSLRMHEYRPRDDPA